MHSQYVIKNEKISLLPGKFYRLLIECIHDLVEVTAIYLRAILPVSSHDADFGSKDFRPFENDLSWEPGTEA